ncbi:MAG: hypothetical protein JOZ58_11550, partial [Acetobacteraceae bacterium]|nr:hypothetical protein [Acetobacteraceae bacterium]
MDAIIRQDLAEEAAQGFPLLKRFPNSETASVAGHFATISPADREILLDALAHYSTIKWSHEVVREKKAHPVLGPYLSRRPLYPPVDWYGERPRKSALKKSVVERLTQAGFTRRKREARSSADVMEFSHPDPSFEGYFLVSFDPGLLRQMDFGFRHWMRGGLKQHFELSDPRQFIPIVGSLAYDHLWDGGGTNNPVCWDLITANNLENIGNLIVEVLNRLSALA